MPLEASEATVTRQGVNGGTASIKLLSWLPGESMEVLESRVP